MTDQTIDARLSRLENLMVTAGDMMLQTSNVSRSNTEHITQLESTMAAAGDMLLQTSELSRRNAEQVSQLEDILQRTSELSLRNAEQIDRNGEQILRLERTMADLTLRSASDRVEFEEWRRTTQAALEKIDRVLDYLMQRDGQ